MEEHERIADEAMEDAERAGEASGNLKRDIKETREDWESKQKSDNVPGAIDPDADQPEEDEDEQPEPEYEQLNPQSADASGGGEQQGSEADDDEGS